MTTASNRSRTFRPVLLAGILPIDRGRIPAEIIAGITLAALAIPEVMGYTKISGTPVITGLYTLLIPAALYAVFASSRHLVVGADSATAAILASGLVGLAATGSQDYLALAGLLALMVGVMLIAAAVIGLGFMADFLSRTVLVGFLTGVGIQVALHAVSELVGLTPPHGGAAMLILSDWRQAVSFNPHVVIVAATVLVIILGCGYASKRLKRSIPGAMFAVVGAILASWYFDLGAHMPVVGQVPVGFPDFSLPNVEWSWSLIWRLLPTALAMVVVVLAQSAATARAYAARYHEPLNETQDLTGLGIANIGAAFTGTFVVNGSPTKTEMVDSAGGRSQLALLTAAVVVLITLLFLTRPLSYLPEAVLSAVVFLIGLKLIDLRGLADIYRQRQSEFWVAAITAMVVVAFGVEQGIVFAILFSLIVHTRHGYRPSNLLISRDAAGHWRASSLDSGAQAKPGLLIYRFNHAMYYANSERMQEEIMQLVAGDTELNCLCIDVSAVDDVDYTAVETLRDIHSTLAARSISLVFGQDVQNINTKSRQQLVTEFGADAFFDSLDAVMAQETVRTK
ncbi:MAG: SulP family inorganic anion transporter [Pseudomonadota bacterium]